MKVSYKVYTDGERRPMVQGTGIAKDLLDKYVSKGLILDSLSELGRSNKVIANDRRRGVKIVLTSTTKKVKVVKKESTGFLKLVLEGRQSETQIIVAAVDKLKGSSGWHRVVCEVYANGLVYKVKSNHKGKTWTDAASHAHIVSKRAA
ncbi:hypothetical protein PODOV026v1_p0003 [Vibrio phage PS32B.1]|nr:hypothetical protein PODOV028v1_20006 [Vibrio phage PS32B.3]QZI86472.1 hypothetical protein PODOV027v1_30006 [Vibrio phage PS35B.3]QZI92176.1 hypothetical protein PODOV026v1_p0003 [Vibrio phage PS32B.1]QZI92281.1 hypothetical protein PODOV004v1_p0046 [Vibrio phage PS32B.11]QZI92300.1 hypothetical protein PODOV025v1_p0003 [Vibrio phage PS32B.6]